MVVGSLRTVSTNKDYCSPVLCLESEVKKFFTLRSHHLGLAGKIWAASVFVVPVSIFEDIRPEVNNP